MGHENTFTNFYQINEHEGEETQFQQKHRSDIRQLSYEYSQNGLKTGGM